MCCLFVADLALALLGLSSCRTRLIFWKDSDAALLARPGESQRANGSQQEKRRQKASEGAAVGRARGSAGSEPTEDLPVSLLLSSPALFPLAFALNITSGEGPLAVPRAPGSLYVPYDHQCLLCAIVHPRAWLLAPLQPWGGSRDVPPMSPTPCPAACSACSHRAARHRVQRFHPLDKSVNAS